MTYDLNLRSVYGEPSSQMSTSKVIWSKIIAWTYNHTHTHTTNRLLYTATYMIPHDQKRECGCRLTQKTKVAGKVAFSLNILGPTNRNLSMQR